MLTSSADLKMCWCLEGTECAACLRPNQCYLATALGTREAVHHNQSSTVGLWQLLLTQMVLQAPATQQTRPGDGPPALSCAQHAAAAISGAPAAAGRSAGAANSRLSMSIHEGEPGMKQHVSDFGSHLHLHESRSAGGKHRQLALGLRQGQNGALCRAEWLFLRT